MDDEWRSGYADLKEDLKNIKIGQDKIWILLNGNGKEGLVAKADRHDLFIKSVQGFITTAQYSLIVGIIGVVIAYLVLRLGIPQ